MENLPRRSNELLIETEQKLLASTCFWWPFPRGFLRELGDDHRNRREKLRGWQNIRWVTLYFDEGVVSEWRIWAASITILVTIQVL